MRHTSLHDGLGVDDLDASSIVDANVVVCVLSRDGLLKVTTSARSVQQ